MNWKYSPTLGRFAQVAEDEASVPQPGERASAMLRILDGLAESFDHREVIREALGRGEQAQAAADAAKAEAQTLRLELARVQQAGTAAPELKAEDIQVEPQRDGANMLMRAVLRAKGYQDVVLEVQRDAAGRWRGLREMRPA